MTQNERRMKWCVELQAVAQIGLTYAKDPFDLERYERVRTIAAEMMSELTALPIEKVRELFCSETGYQTPKLDTRSAVFRDRKILLVQEKDGRWSLPGGWVDVGLSVGENAVKEVREEAGLMVRAERLIAVQDREKHNQPVYAWKICKVFLLCTLLGGQFEPNPETIASGWFSLESLPPLSEEKNTREQIEMCFRASEDPAWQTLFD